jgi:hypothetical protein
MSSSDSPPVKHTRTVLKFCRTPVCEQQSTPPSEETSNTSQDSDLTQIARATAPEESPLSSIAEGTGKEIRLPEGDSSPANNVSSDHGPVREIVEEVDTSQNNPERSYTTAPGSFSPSAGPVNFRSPSEVHLDKGKGHAYSTPFQEAGSSLHLHEREASPEVSMSGDAWTKLEDTLQTWSHFAEQGKADALQNQRDMANFNERIDNSYQKVSEVMDAMRGIQ